MALFDPALRSDTASSRETENSSKSFNRGKRYAFDHVLCPASKQMDVFQAAVSPIMAHVMTGINATVFCYGATGTGKTHTMLGTGDDPGLMPLTLRSLFGRVEQSEEAVVVSLSYVEVYNEMVADLLVEDSKELDIRDDPIEGPIVVGAQKLVVESAQAVLELLEQGNRRRSQDATAFNQTSSRSHALLQIFIEQRAVIPVRGSTKTVVTHSKLSLIDLAGSERALQDQEDFKSCKISSIVAKRAESRSKIRREGSNINKSLLALGNCINALASAEARGRKARFVPYRDSKLTRLLKDSLSANCLTVMVANVSPAVSAFDETKNTLEYANRAKNIKVDTSRRIEELIHEQKYQSVRQIPMMNCVRCFLVSSGFSAEAEALREQGANSSLAPGMDTKLKTVMWCGSKDGFLDVRYLASGELVCRLEGSYYTHERFTSALNRLDGEWYMNRGKQRLRLDIWCMQLFQGNVWAGDGAGTMHVFRELDGSILTKVKLHAGGITSMLIVDDMLWTGSLDWSVRIFNPRNKAHHSPRGPNHANWVCCLARLGDCVWSGSQDASIRLWNISEQRHVKTVTGHTDGVLCLCTVDSSIWSGGADGSIRIWDEQGICKKTIQQHEGWVTHIIRVQDHVLSCGPRTKIIAWDPKTVTPMHRLSSIPGYIITISCNGPHLWIATSRKSVYVFRVWHGSKDAKDVNDVSTNRKRAKSEGLKSPVSPIPAVLPSPRLAGSRIGAGLKQLKNCNTEISVQSRRNRAKSSGDRLTPKSTTSNRDTSVSSQKNLQSEIESLRSQLKSEQSRSSSLAKQLDQERQENKQILDENNQLKIRISNLEEIMSENKDKLGEIMVQWTQEREEWRRERLAAEMSAMESSQSATFVQLEENQASENEDIEKEETEDESEDIEKDDEDESEDESEDDEEEQVEETANHSTAKGVRVVTFDEANEGKLDLCLQENCVEEKDPETSFSPEEIFAFSSFLSTHLDFTSDHFLVNRFAISFSFSLYSMIDFLLVEFFFFF